MLKIGFVGLDSIGQKMASHIMRKKGHSIMGYDLRIENRELFHDHGGISVEDPDIIYENCNLIILRLPHELMVTKCIEDILKTRRNGLTIINLSPVLPGKLNTLKTELRSSDIVLLHAPILKVMEEDRDFPKSLGVYGDEEELSRIKKYMSKIYTDIVYLGLMENELKH